MPNKKDIVVVSSAFCLPYRDWEAKARADKQEDQILIDAGYNVRRIANVPDEIDEMLEMAKEISPLAIVFETDIGTWVEKGYKTRKGKTLKKLKPLADAGTKILSMNDRQLSAEDAVFIEAIAEPSMFGNSGNGATILEYLANLQ